MESEFSLLRPRHQAELGVGNQKATQDDIQIWIDLQRDLLPVLRKEAYLALTPVLEGLIRVLELIGM